MVLSWVWCEKKPMVWPVLHPSQCSPHAVQRAGDCSVVFRIWGFCYVEFHPEHSPKFSDLDVLRSHVTSSHLFCPTCPFKIIEFPTFHSPSATFLHTLMNMSMFCMCIPLFLHFSAFTWHYSIYWSILFFLFHLYTFSYFAPHHESHIRSCGTFTATLWHMHQSPQYLPSISFHFQSGSLAYHETLLPSKP